ncbi:hypothetical protein LXL04_024164 [Taraxacum kok-saghyz]
MTSGNSSKKMSCGYLNDQFMYLQKLQLGDESDPDFSTFDQKVNRRSWIIIRLLMMFTNSGVVVPSKFSPIFCQKALKLYITFCQTKKIMAKYFTLCALCSSTSARRKISTGELTISLYCNYEFKVQANHEYILNRNKLEALFKLEQQILQAGG